MDTLGFTSLDVGEVTLNVGCQGEGPTIVLLHGYPEFHGSWAQIIPGLLREGYRVVVPDQRGYNLSEKPSDIPSYQMDHLVADINGLIAATGQQKVLLVGHDWGGTVAWVFAHRHPDRVRGLVVMAGPHPDIWGHPEVDPVQAAATANYVPLLAAGEAAFELGIFDIQLSPHLSADVLALHHAAWNQPNAKVSMNNWYRANLHPNVTMPTNVVIETPALVTWGMKDQYTVPSILDHLPTYVKNLKTHTWAEADHWLLFQNVDETVGLITEFEHGLAP